MSRCPSPQKRHAPQPRRLKYSLDQDTRRILVTGAGAFKSGTLLVVENGDMACVLCETEKLDDEWTLASLGFV
jgi:hypothetical protein